MINKPHAGGWTAPRVDILTTMWMTGSSASNIATALGDGLTRNGVIGKVHRLKLRRPGSAKKKALSRLGALAAKIARAHVKHPDEASTVKALAAMREVSPDGRKILRGSAWDALPGTVPILLDELGTSDCRWPIGDYRPFLFCGGHVDSGIYCTAHRTIATRV